MKLKLLFLITLIPILGICQLNQLVAIAIKTGDLVNGKIDTLKTVIVEESKDSYLVLNPRDYEKQITVPKKIVESITPIKFIETESPFIGATIIKVYNSLTFEENFRTVGRQLLNSGFELESKDADFGFIRTKPRVSESLNIVLGNAIYIYEFNIGEGYVEMSSRGTTSALVTDRQLVSNIINLDLVTFYEGIKGKTFSQPWENLKKIASSMNGEKITYKIGAKE